MRCTFKIIWMFYSWCFLRTVLGWTSQRPRDFLRHKRFQYFNTSMRGNLILSQLRFLEMEKKINVWKMFRGGMWGWGEAVVEGRRMFNKSLLQLGLSRSLLPEFPHPRTLFLIYLFRYEIYLETSQNIFVNNIKYICLLQLGLSRSLYQNFLLIYLFKYKKYL